MILAKYVSDWGEWCSAMVSRQHGKGLWKGIWVYWDEFWKWIRFQVGNGDKVKFWTDKWSGDEVFRIRFPQLYRLAIDRNASVADYLVQEVGSFFWDVRLRRSL